MAVIERGLSNVSDPLPLREAKAACFNRFGLVDEAVTTMDETMRDFPGSFDSYLRLAIHHIKTEQFDDARSVLENGIRMVPSNERLLSAYGKLLSDHFELKLALPAYSSLVDLFPDSAEYRTLRGNCYANLELHDLAMQHQLELRLTGSVRVLRRFFPPRGGK